MVYTKSAQAVPLAYEDFSLEENDAVLQDTIKALIRNDYEKRIIDALNSGRKGASKALNNVAKMLLDGGEMSKNALEEVETDGDDNEAVVKIRNEYKKLLYTSFLLVRSPTGGKVSALSEKTLTVNEDDKRRKMEYDNFVKDHPAASENAPPFVRVDSMVRTYDEMKKDVKEYFDKYACRSSQAIIVFNGHGNRLGMRFVDGNTFVDEFIDYVQKLLSETKLNSDLPEKVFLIFAQCFSFLKKKREIPGIEVIHFTSDEKGRRTTQSIIRWHKLTEDVVDSTHLQLQEHAETEKDDYDENKHKGKFEKLVESKAENIEVSTTLENTQEVNIENSNLQSDEIREEKTSIVAENDGNEKIREAEETTEKSEDTQLKVEQNESIE